MPLEKIPYHVPVQAPPVSSLPITTGLYAHFDPSDPFSIERRYPTRTDSSRNIIGRWRSPANHNTVYLSNQNNTGLDYLSNYVYSSGVGDFLGLVDTNTTTLTNFTVINVIRWSSGRLPVFMGPVSFNPNLSTSPRCYTASLWGTSLRFEWPTGVSVPQLYSTFGITTMTCAGNKNTVELRCNGTPLIPNNVLPNEAVTLTPGIATDPTASNQPATRLFYSLYYRDFIIFDRVLTAQELNTVEQHLAAKWGISI